jgi:hemolysin activation/secretion protein
MDIPLKTLGFRSSINSSLSLFFPIRFNGLLWLLLCGLFLCEPAEAAPDLGSQELLRQQEREQYLRSEQEQAPDVRLPAVTVPKSFTRLPDKESPCFPISHLQLTGELADHFQFALEPAIQKDDSAIGRCLGTQGINIVLTRIQNAIIAQGYVTTRVLVAPQDLKSGTLYLTIIPGRIHAIRFSPESSPRGRYENALPLHTGDLLNLRDIEQGLENIKRVPTAEVDIKIEPATGDNIQPGESDLVISYQEATPFRITLNIDDSGSKFTGRTQGNITLSLDNPLTLNDLFYASFGHDLGGGHTNEHGTRSYIFHYSLPFGYWSLGLTMNSYNYHQTVVGLNQNYIYSGESRGSEIKLSRIAYRDSSRKTTASIRGYVKSSNNFIDDTEIEVQRRRMSGWEAALTHREFMGSSTLDLNLAYRQGTGAMHAMVAPEEAFNEGTARPQIITTQVALNVPFSLYGQVLRYNGSWQAQWNQTPLIPQDRFAIGGRYTVRGFNGENTLSAERGWLLRNDLGIPLGNSRQELYLGIDYGHVSGRSADLLRGMHLSGGVLGLRGVYKGLQYDLFVGTPLSEPDGFEEVRTAGFNVVYQY